ncbi:unnamed protein product [Nezara viridula]|uniref:Cytochrome P450 n=1 Tax=Nezara viridula TaxID=85310 RepID=A0A9P0EDR5_NEZVI|nr:unnamed protein product [Nezara viridula]
MDGIYKVLLTILLANLVFGVILWLRVRKLCSFPGFLGVPVIGNLFYFYKTLFLITADSLENHLKEVTEKHGKNGFCFHISYGYKITAIITNPEIIKKISFHPNLIDKSYEMYGGFLDYMRGPFSRPRSDEKWKMWRKEYNIFLKRSCVDNDYFNTYITSAETLVNMMLDSTSAYGASIALTQNVTMRTLFGVETDLVYNKEIIKVLTRLIEMGAMLGANTNIARAIAPIVRPIAEKVSGKAVVIRKTIFQKIYKTIVSKKEPLSEPRLAMNVAAKSIESNESKRTLLQLMQEVLFTSAHTVASALSNTIILLAVQPDMQERAFKEQCEIFGNDSRDPTIDDVERMEFLGRFIKECLRFLGPPFSGRKATADINLDGTIIPKGSIVVYLFNSITMDSKYWQNPNVFEPDRFLEESDLMKYTFTPFGVGVRSCPGMYFATTLIKITLSKILRTVKLRPVDKDFRFESLKYRSSLLTEIANHPKLHVERRA